MLRTDVTIVGGGIAGLASAVTLCSQSHLDVLLVEKNGIGANKTTPLVFPEMIFDLGLEKSIYQYYHKYSFHSPLGSVANFDYKRNALASVDYSEACNILYRKACQNGLKLSKAKAINWFPLSPDPSIITRAATPHR